MSWQTLIFSIHHSPFCCPAVSATLKSHGCPSRVSTAMCLQLFTWEHFSTWPQSFTDTAQRKTIVDFVPFFFSGPDNGVTEPSWISQSFSCSFHALWVGSSYGVHHPHQNSLSATSYSVCLIDTKLASYYLQIQPQIWKVQKTEPTVHLNLGPWIDTANSWGMCKNVYFMVDGVCWGCEISANINNL